MEFDMEFVEFTEVEDPKARPSTFVNERPQQAMSADSPRHARTGGPLIVPSQPPSDRGLIDAVSGFINDVTLSASSALDPKDVIQWARFETADINEPRAEGEGDGDISPLLLILGYGSGVQVWLVPPSGEAQEVLSWRQGTVRVLRILPTPQHGDCFASKRPLIALCDSASPGPPFCSLSFISIRGGEQVKSIKFKNQILDVLANKRSVVVAFSERFAVFDAGTLEDRIAITTCYPCPCPLGGSQSVNPLALGDRWLAYADKKLHPAKRSSGGCEGEGVTSYTATVLHAAKSLSKGLRGLGESVAHSLAGGRGASQSPSPPHTDAQQPGVVTILDIEGSEYDDGQDSEDPYDPMVAHFLAHSEAIIALKFDASGMLLVTADRRGHDFHVFRINPHPCGPSLASVHHLYILHRGDTTAKVQDIAISSDSRWTAITTLRGTTHVFAISPYGGACGVRTHTQPRVVNRLSRFHRSAGLPIHATAPPRSGSPVSESLGQGAWFPNPRLPPYPLPVMSAPLAQLRPTANLPTHTITRTSSGRQRLSSLSEDCNSAPLPARARFGLSVMGGLSVRAPAHPALYLITHTGCLLHLLLHARPARSVPKEKVCDESPIEVEVEPVAQWGLARPPPPAPDLLAPLPPASPLLQPHTNKMNCSDMCMSEEERWLSQVEIVTHAGPHRRLWMGPQFVFKTYNSTGSNSSLSEAEAVEVDTSAAGSVARSNPVNMPGVRPIVPVLIDSGSASSLEHSPSDSFRRKSLLADSGRAASVCDVQLREDLAEAMKEDHGCPVPERRTPPRAGVLRAVGPRGTVVPRADPAPQAPPDPDLYTTPNTDETTFRPVVRAANTLSLSPDMIVRPLPRDTTIPVQNVQPLAKYSPEDEPLPLNTDVVIPAALTRRSESGFVPVKTISDEFSIDVSVNRVRDLERPATAWKDACESSVPAERESDIESLPKSNRPSDDIQPIARARVKKSPTPKSVSDRDSDVRIKEMSKEREAKEIKGAITVECEELREPRVSKRKEVREPDVVVLDDKIDTRPVTVSDEYVTTTSVLPVSSTEKTREDVRKVETVKTEETREKSKKSDKIESVKSNLDETRTKAKKIDKAADTAVTDETREKSTKVEKPDIVKTVVPDTREVSKKVEKLETVKIVKENTIEKSKRLEKTDVLKTSVEKTVDAPKKVAKPDLVKDGLEETREKSKKVEKTEIINTETEESHRSKKIDKPVPVKAVVETIEKTKKVEKLEDVKAVAEDTREKSKFIEKLELVKTVKQEPHEKSPKVEKCDIVKSEDQAWDLLLNESEKPAVLNVTQQTVGFDKFEEKPKAKKIRKGKKGQEELQAKEDEDSFIEIHAIEEAKTPSCGELVSISTPFEDIDATSSYLSKARKPRSSKSFTPERDFEPEVKPIQFVPDDDYDLTLVKLKSPRKNSSVSAFIEGWPEPSFTRKTTSIHSDKPATDSLKVKHDISTSETSSTSLKEPLKAKKSKSLSPYSETSRKHTSFESEGKDVYVIDSTKDEFPEIQITRGSKNRKKSPQPLERKSVEKEVIQPIKSWSSIAAAKTDKKEETSPALKDYEKIDSWEEQDVAASLEYQKSSNEHVSLQEKLIQLCKRTDIMVAECDAPTELNFVEEHHTDHDLPPLEPLDFGLDDYKLEVMRDSLLETNDTKLSSPICKININDILSSIKETTSKAIESSTFNLVDVEKVPAQKEKGFSVVEDHKITTQEVKIDDETKEESSVVEVVEKSSDEDNVTPPVSTDVPLPAKQSSKYKKSRRKKK